MVAMHWPTFITAAVVGLAASTLSSALNFGPGHALGWLSPSVVPSFAIALLLLLPALALLLLLAALAPTALAVAALWML